MRVVRELKIELVSFRLLTQNTQAPTLDTDSYELVPSDDEQPVSVPSTVVRTDDKVANPSESTQDDEEDDEEYETDDDEDDEEYGTDEEEDGDTDTEGEDSDEYETDTEDDDEPEIIAQPPNPVAAPVPAPTAVPVSQHVPQPVKPVRVPVSNTASKSCSLL